MLLATKQNNDYVQTILETIISDTKISQTPMTAVEEQELSARFPTFIQQVDLSTHNEFENLAIAPQIQNIVTLGKIRQNQPANYDNINQLSPLSKAIKNYINDSDMAPVIKELSTISTFFLPYLEHISAISNDEITIDTILEAFNDLGIHKKLLKPMSCNTLTFHDTNISGLDLSQIDCQHLVIHNCKANGINLSNAYIGKLTLSGNTECQSVITSPRTTFSLLFNGEPNIEISENVILNEKALEKLRLTDLLFDIETNSYTEYKPDTTYRQASLLPVYLQESIIKPDNKSTSNVLLNKPDLYDGPIDMNNQSETVTIDSSDYNTFKETLSSQIKSILTNANDKTSAISDIKKILNSTM